MSHTQKAPEEPEFDFWEFVSCARCHLPFIPEPGGPPAVPFWITECGHVVCNGHLRPNKTCAKCGAQDIEVAPLQREMEAPMSSWFASVPHAFDALAFATRFQIETLASLARYYRRKYTQHRQLIERLKGDVMENKELKRVIEELSAENERLRSRAAGPSEMLNGNGKRQMADVHRHPSGAFTNSSPQSSLAGMSTNRLTLPPSHQQPSFTPRKHRSDDERATENYSVRPGSRNLEHYAYVPARAQQMQANPTPLSHAQASAARHALSRRQLSNTLQEDAHISNTPVVTMSTNGRQASSGFRPAPAPHPVRRSGAVPNGPRSMPPPLVQQPSARIPQQSGSFRMPATPRGPPQVEHHQSRRFSDSGPAHDFADQSLQSNRFMPVASSAPPQRYISTSAGHQRFATPAPAPGPSHPRLMRTSTDIGSAATSRASGTGQRLPFVPGQSGYN